MNTQAPAIVLIEKDEVTLDIYQRELNKSFKVFGFTEISNVLEIIAQQDIQAVVIEPEIHSGQGWELIHSIHERFPGRMIPVIVCSTRDTEKMAIINEVAKHMTKPVLPRELKEKVLEVLEKRNN